MKEYGGLSTLSTKVMLLYKKDGLCATADAICLVYLCVRCLGVDLLNSFYTLIFTSLY